MFRERWVLQREGEVRSVQLVVGEAEPVTVR